MPQSDSPTPTFTSASSVYEPSKHYRRALEDIESADERIPQLDSDIHPCSNTIKSFEHKLDYIAQHRRGLIRSEDILPCDKENELQKFAMLKEVILAEAIRYLNDMMDIDGCWINSTYFGKEANIAALRIAREADPVIYAEFRERVLNLAQAEGEMGNDLNALMALKVSMLKIQPQGEEDTPPFPKIPTTEDHPLLYFTPPPSTPKLH